MRNKKIFSVFVLTLGGSTEKTFNFKKIVSIRNHEDN